MYCTECGVKNDDDAIFCTNCGAKINRNKDLGISNKFKNPKKGLWKTIAIIFVFLLLFSAIVLSVQYIKNVRKEQKITNLSIFIQD